MVQIDNDESLQGFGDVSGFEHEILDIILRMEERRKIQLQEQKKKAGDSRKGKNKADTELKKLACGLLERSGKKESGRSHKAHSRGESKQLFGMYKV